MTHHFHLTSPLARRTRGDPGRVLARGGERWPPASDLEKALYINESSTTFTADTSTRVQRPNATRVEQYVAFPKLYKNDFFFVVFQSFPQRVAKHLETMQRFTVMTSVQRTMRKAQVL